VRLTNLALTVVGIVSVATLLFLFTMILIAKVRRAKFLPSLGKVVRIATPCRVVVGTAHVPGTLGLTPDALVWDAPLGHSGSLPLGRIKRLETDRRLASGVHLLRREALRVTSVDGGVTEFLLWRGPAHEWRRAIGEWTPRLRGEDRAG
jgi:hypothetical protein